MKFRLLALNSKRMHNYTPCAARQIECSNVIFYVYLYYANEVQMLFSLPEWRAGNANSDETTQLPSRHGYYRFTTNFLYISRNIYDVFLSYQIFGMQKK